MNEVTQWYKGHKALFVALAVASAAVSAGIAYEYQSALAAVLAAVLLVAGGVRLCRPDVDAAPSGKGVPSGKPHGSTKEK